MEDVNRSSSKKLNSNYYVKLFECIVNCGESILPDHISMPGFWARKIPDLDNEWHVSGKDPYGNVSEPIIASDFHEAAQKILDIVLENACPNAPKHKLERIPKKQTPEQKLQKG